ncbi:hypothetical protein GTV15_20535, partial [Streptomyces sp. SID7803]|nr:hypothetical protein [Streptomyces sp. SID7803]
PPPPPVDLEPQRQTVYAQVNARFTMTPRRNSEFHPPPHRGRAHPSTPPHNSTLVNNPSRKGG